jgi:hypothetical protein
MSSPIPAAEPTNPSPKSPVGRRALKIIGALLGTIVALVLFWIAAQFLLRRPRPAMMFTQADLPALPSIADNGWEILKNDLGPTGQPQRVDKDLISLCDPKATFTDRWVRVVSNSSKLSTVAGHEHTQKWLKLIDKAASLPQFADACPLEFDAQCPRPMYLLTLHQMQEAVVLNDAITSHWEDAFARTVRMLRMDDLFLPSARATLEQAVARSLVHRSLKLVDVLLDGAADEQKGGRGPNAAQLAEFARQIDPLVTRIREEDLSPMKTVIAEYLYSVYLIEHLNYFPQAKSSFVRDIFYDPNHTLEMLNGRFDQYVAFAQSNATSPAPEFPQTWNWVLRNPIGHLALESTRGAIEIRVPAMVKDRAAFLKDQEALHKGLVALARGT